jgi:hypothetical protein
VTTTTEYRTPAAAMRQTGDIMVAEALTEGTTAAGFNYINAVDVETAVGCPERAAGAGRCAGRRRAAGAADRSLRALIR